MTFRFWIAAMTDERGTPRAACTCLSSWPTFLPSRDASLDGTSTYYSPPTFRFWDCCGEEREDAPGCITGWHLDLLFSPDLQVLGLLR